jgi:hypothetical protein
MNFFKRLFTNAERTDLIECPRCLGKGSVDINDIKRLGRQAYWSTGKCAYCLGKRQVAPEMPSQIAPDNVYLVADLSWDERQQLLDGSIKAERIKERFQERFDAHVADIRAIHAETGFTAEEIADQYFKPMLRGKYQQQREVVIMNIDAVLKG